MPSGVKSTALAPKRRRLLGLPQMDPRPHPPPAHPPPRVPVQPTTPQPSCVLSQAPQQATGAPLAVVKLAGGLARHPEPMATCRPEAVVVQGAHKVANPVCPPFRQHLAGLSDT